MRLNDSTGWRNQTVPCDTVKACCQEAKAGLQPTGIRISWIWFRILCSSYFAHMKPHIAWGIGEYHHDNEAQAVTCASVVSSLLRWQSFTVFRSAHATLDKAQITSKQNHLMVYPTKSRVCLRPSLFQEGSSISEEG